MISIETLANDAGLKHPRRYRVDWRRAEAGLGAALPTDYKNYVYWFGPGGFEDYLYVCVPGIENSTTELGTLLTKKHRSIEVRNQINPRRSQPYPVFPEKNGWLPWGFTIDGDTLYWVTSSGNPESWTIAASSRADDLAYFEGNFSEYLHTYVWDTGEMVFFDETDSPTPIPFEPNDGKWSGGGERLEPYGYFESHK